IDCLMASAVGIDGINLPQTTFRLVYIVDLRRPGEVSHKKQGSPHARQRPKDALRSNQRDHSSNTAVRLAKDNKTIFKYAPFTRAKGIVAYFYTPYPRVKRRRRRTGHQPLLSAPEDD